MSTERNPQPAAAALPARAVKLATREVYHLLLAQGHSKGRSTKRQAATLARAALAGAAQATESQYGVRYPGGLTTPAPDRDQAQLRAETSPGVMVERSIGPWTASGDPSGPASRTP